MEGQESQSDDCASNRKGVSYMANADGDYLYCRVWEPTIGQTQKPMARAAVFIAHGLGSHCLLGTDKLVELLTGHGILVFAHDHVNHGRSEGERGVIPDPKIQARDVLQHVDKITSKHPGIPVFLLGMSMGGLVSIMAVLERPGQFAGIIIGAPALVPLQSSWQVTLLRALVKLTPSIGLAPPHDVRQRTKDPEKQKLIAEDRYEWGKERINVLSLHRFVEEARRTMDLLSHIECPLLVLQGTDDEFVSLSVSRTLYNQAKSTDKELKIYPNCRHSLLLEEEEDTTAILQDIVEFLFRIID